ncbi:unnamed protein product, partial [Tilletia caries]
PPVPSSMGPMTSTWTRLSRRCQTASEWGNALVPHYARDLGRGVSRPLMKQTSFQARASRAHVLRRRLPSLDFRGAISNLMSPSTARMTDSRFDVRLGTQSTSCSRSTRSPSSQATLRGLAPSHVV